MNTTLRLTWMLLLGLAAASCTSSEKPDMAGQDGVRAEGTATNVSVTVESVDVPGRQITLKSAQGKTGTFKVGEEVQRLSEIKAGDMISAEHRMLVLAQLREPTEEEKKQPLIVTKGLERAPSTQPPSAIIARTVRLVVLIENLDPTTRSFMLRGPLDGTVQVRVDDAAAFGALKPGQAIVAIFTETLKLSVQPGSK